MSLGLSPYLWNESDGHLCYHFLYLFQSMLYLVGLGLGDAKDITVKGLEIVQDADFVFLEGYTSVLCVGQQVLVRKWKNVYLYIQQCTKLRDCREIFAYHLRLIK